jgi:hypothetical protein
MYKDYCGASKPVSSNMREGQIQLAMEETEGRKDRDARAIRWMLGNLTGDSEQESFTMAIPGSYNGGWSFEVWTRVSESTKDKNRRAHQRDLPFYRGHSIYAEVQLDDAGDCETSYFYS